MQRSKATRRQWRLFSGFDIEFSRLMAADLFIGHFLKGVLPFMFHPSIAAGKVCQYALCEKETRFSSCLRGNSALVQVAGLAVAQAPAAEAGCPW